MTYLLNFFCRKHIEKLDPSSVAFAEKNIRQKAAT